MNGAMLRDKARRTLEGSWLKESLILYGVAFPTILSRYIGSYTITILFSIVTVPLFFGYVRRMMKLRNGQEDPIDELLYYYKDERALGVIIIQILTSLLVFFWGFLLVIPGIIASLTYSFVHMLRVENPKKEPREILAMSRQMTNGYKIDLFVTRLSFIGWGILIGIVGKLSSRLGIIVGIPITVYMIMTHIEFFYSVRRSENNRRSE